MYCLTQYWGKLDSFTAGFMYMDCNFNTAAFHYTAKNGTAAMSGKFTALGNLNNKKIYCKMEFNDHIDLSSKQITLKIKEGKKKTKKKL